MWRRSGWSGWDSVIECTGRALGETRVRALMERFQSCANTSVRDSDKIHFLRLIASMARQIGDAMLFEKTRFLMFENYSPADYIDIARVYMENGDADTAFERLSRIPADERFRTSERDALLLSILEPVRGVISDTVRNGVFITDA